MIRCLCMPSQLLHTNTPGIKMCRKWVTCDNKTTRGIQILTSNNKLTLPPDWRIASVRRQLCCLKWRLVIQRITQSVGGESGGSRGEQQDCFPEMVTQHWMSSEVSAEDTELIACVRTGGTRWWRQWWRCRWCSPAEEDNIGDGVLGVDGGQTERVTSFPNLGPPFSVEDGIFFNLID